MRATLLAVGCAAAFLGLSWYGAHVVATRGPARSGTPAGVSEVRRLADGTSVDVLARRSRRGALEITYRTAEYSESEAETVWNAFAGEALQRGLRWGRVVALRDDGEGSTSINFFRHSDGRWYRQREFDGFVTERKGHTWPGGNTWYTIMVTDANGETHRVDTKDRALYDRAVEGARFRHTAGKYTIDPPVVTTVASPAARESAHR